MSVDLYLCDRKPAGERLPVLFLGLALFKCLTMF